MSERDVKLRRVSGRQLDLLWEYLNTHRDVARAFNRSLQAKEYATRKWKEVADLLNAQGEGAHKDWKAWSKYWVDYKAKLKKRASAVRSTLTRTGGVPATEVPLSEIEKKFLQIVGEDFGQGLPGVRVEPFPECSEPTASCSVDSPASISILIPYQPEQNIENPPSNITPPIVIPITPPRAPSPAPDPVAATPARPSRSPRRRRRREPPMSQEAARRALIQSSQIRAEAAERSCHALESIGRGIQEIGLQLSDIRNSLHRIESNATHGAVPRAAE